MTVRILVLLILVLLASCSSPRGVYHTVREGQTLYRISRTYGVDERYLARINRIDNPTLLRTGERLFIPGADRVREVPSTASSPPSSPPSSPAPPAPAAPARAPQRTPPATAPRAAAPKPPVPAKGHFVWPLKGEILRRFGQGGNPPSKGLEIAVPLRTPVLSAAAGKVIYSGDGIRSYGNLIILKHDDEYFTVYGFNEKNMVEAGSFVSKGERIALSGVAPNGGRPRLYFEIRHGKEAVDPIFYLP